MCLSNSSLSQVHTIRLHGPWQAQVQEQFDGSPAELDAVSREPQRVKIPDSWVDWPGAEFRGRVCYTRKFNLPTQLDVDQVVWLVVYCGADSANLFLNDDVVGRWSDGQKSFRMDVREKLRPHNTLRIELTLPRGANEIGGLTGGVRLEIEQ